MTKKTSGWRSRSALQPRWKRRMHRWLSLSSWLPALLPQRCMPFGRSLWRTYIKTCCKYEEGVMWMEASIVGRGVDTLLLNVYYVDAEGKPDKRDLASFLVQQLNAWKNRAILEEQPVVVPWAFQGQHLHMYPHGAGRGQWTWLLTSDLLTLCVSRGRLNCIALVRLSSEYLWSCPSLCEAIARVRRFLCDHLESQVYLQVSEVHLCTDVTWSFEQVDYRQEFVSRSRKRAGYEVAEGDGEIEDYTYGLRRTGLAFSARGPISCAIYDKAREVKRSGKLWFEDLWSGNGWADGWLRLVVPRVDDTTRSRWPVHPVWQEVQAAFSTAMSRPDDFHEVIRKRKEGWNTDRAIESTMGFATSLAAHVGGELARPDADLSLFLRWLYEAGMDYLEFRKREFAQEVLRKRIEFGLQSMSG